MQAADFLRSVIVPTLVEINRDSAQARLQLLATSIQESALSTLEQVHGPAHSFWQEEPNGIAAVMRNPGVNFIANAYCERHGFAWDEPHIYLEVATAPGQALACVIARCLLLADGHPLPALGDEESAWQCYLRNWRPGKPDRARWTTSYNAAQAAIQELNQ